MLYRTKVIVDEFMELSNDEKYAFLGLCLGGGGYHTYGTNIQPNFSKAECKFVDFEDFWMKKAIEMGLVEAKLTRSFVALGVKGQPESTEHRFVLAPKGQFIFDMYDGEYEMRREMDNG